MNIFAKLFSPKSTHDPNKIDFWEGWLFGRMLDRCRKKANRDITYRLRRKDGKWAYVYDNTMEPLSPMFDSQEEAEKWQYARVGQVGGPQDWAWLPKIPNTGKVYMR